MIKLPNIQYQDATMFTILTGAFKSTMIIKTNKEKYPTYNFSGETVTVTTCSIQITVYIPYLRNLNTAYHIPSYIIAVTSSSEIIYIFVVSLDTFMLFVWQ